MLHASVQSESLVVSAEGLLKRGVIECVVHADGLCTRTNMCTYCRKEPGTCFPRCIWTSQPEGARVLNRETVNTHMCISISFSLIGLKRARGVSWRVRKTDAKPILPCARCIERFSHTLSAE